MQSLFIRILGPFARTLIGSFATFLFLFTPLHIHAQCGNLNIQHQYDIPSTCATMTMTMKHDQLSRPYLYVAAKEAGLKIYDMTGTPALVHTIPTTAFNGLHVMNLSQVDNSLYLALGNHFSDDQNSGMAIIDVSDPVHAFVMDFWFDSTFTGGAGIVEAQGDYAYLGAMKNGLIVLDISDKHNISFVSQYIPSILYPDPNPDPAKYNARGMVVRNNIVYLCYDAGGLRIINVSDKSHPMETGKYANPLLNGRPRAYNNLVLDDTLAYVAVDYCGLEVLNISDTSHITLVSWWNPWNCQTNPLNWFSSPGYANEIAYNKNCKLLFLSTGRSDLYVVNIAHPDQPDSCDSYGGVDNTIGTWGVSIYENYIYLSYICSVIPFPSNWTGVKILSYTNQCTSGIYETGMEDFTIHSDPSSHSLLIDIPSTLYAQPLTLCLADVMGRTLLRQNIGHERTIRITTPEARGVYFLLVEGSGIQYVRKCISWQ